MSGGSDAFGRALLDWARGGTEPEVVEREDGFDDVGAGHEVYLADFPDWEGAERAAVGLARGRVLDVGCGAGRVALHLQRRGFEVLGIDTSPLALRAARLRGVERVRRQRADALGAELSAFDTIVLFGNNFGLFGTPERTHRVLRAWGRRVAPGTLLLAESTNPWCGGAPAMDRAYYRRNRERGRMPGQVRVRTRYRRWVTPWFEWLFVSRSEMRAVVRDTGWHMVDVFGSTPGEPYVAVLRAR